MNTEFGKWIKASEQKPEIGVTVLTCQKAGGRAICTWDGKFWICTFGVSIGTTNGGRGSFDYHSQLAEDYADYWTPIPELPF